MTAAARPLSRSVRWEAAGASWEFRDTDPKGDRIPAKSTLLAVLGAPVLSTVQLPAEAMALLDTQNDPVIDEPTREAMRERYRGSAQFRQTTGWHYPALLNPREFTTALRQHSRAD